MEHQICSYYHCFPDFDEKDFLQFYWHYETVIKKLNKKKDSGNLTAQDLASKFREYANG